MMKRRFFTTISITILSMMALSCATGSKSGPTEILKPPLADNRIPAIQGRAHTSPFVDRKIEDIQGIITAIVPGGRAPGFWMQDPEGDDDNETSDAIFVSTQGVEVTLAVGDKVSVTGTIAEVGREGSLTTTQVKDAAVTVLAQGQDLPTSVLVGLKGRRIPSRMATEEMKKYRPDLAAIDFWESLEGMRVEVENPVVVGPTSSYGEIVVLPDRGAGAKERSTRGGVVMTENAPNPERLTLDSRISGKLPEANVGDQFEGRVSGVLDFGFGNYRLVVTSTLPELVATSVPVEVTHLKGDENRLTVATYNVLNLSAVSQPSRFEAVGRSIAVNLGSPDVIGIQEIQDDSGPKDDGVVSAAETFGKLIDAIVAAGGPRYEYREIDPLDKRDGGQPGGNIRVGFLFNSARVSFVDRGNAGPEDSTALEGEGGDVHLTLSPGRIDPSNPCFAGGGEGELAEPTRKSLAGEFRFHDRTVFIIVNHLKSKRGDEGLFSPTQPPVRKTEEQRTCQTKVIGEFAGSILKKDAEAAVIVLGDMNEQEYAAPIKALEETSGLTNLHERVIVSDRYTYVYEGNAQVLDHILVSPSLLAGAEIDIVHVNADFVESLAASDHDPVLSRLKVR